MTTATTNATKPVDQFLRIALTAIVAFAFGALSGGINELENKADASTQGTPVVQTAESGATPGK